ncbi:MAG: nucleoside-diphosphate kinase [Firmicutes bacterium]|nr:nucleoside-diphosphate kinase [Bacillota bacterium]
MEKTLVLVKPDGVAKGLTGEIISRFERRGLKICALKLFTLSREQAQTHYQEHAGKSFFNSLVDFITSGPLVAMVIGGQDAVRVVRKMMGQTNPVEALPGTIRGDYALEVTQNIVHGSDSLESADREIAHFFPNGEMVD